MAESTVGLKAESSTIPENEGQHKLLNVLFKDRRFKVSRGYRARVSLKSRNLHIAKPAARQQERTLRGCAANVSLDSRELDRSQVCSERGRYRMLLAQPFDLNGLLLVQTDQQSLRATV